MSEAKNDDGGHAYPVCFEGGKNSGESPYFHEGMSLRDWFAGQSLANPYTHSEQSPDKVAGWAYQVADAMIAARKGGVK